MKRLVTLIAAAMLLAGAVQTVAHAGGKQKKAPQPRKEAAAEVIDSSEIHWMTLDDLQIAMNKKPKKVWIDVYTDWCGWCKKMDKETFKNKQVVAYLNKNFYAVKLNAEQREDIRFGGKMYKYNEERRVHDFAVEILRGQLSYPTSVFMAEGFTDAMPIPGYRDVKSMELVLTYLNGSLYRNTQFPEYEKSFVPTW